MCETEVSLRLAFWLIREKLLSENDNKVFVAVPRAAKFDGPGFLRDNHWQRTRSTVDWQAQYHCPDAASRLVVCLVSGQGDVVCQLKDGRVFRAEAAKGPLFNSANSEEYRLLHEALGQLMTIEDASKQELLAVAVPRSPRFTKLAERWREAPLIKYLRIHILTVGRDGDVEGLSACSSESSWKQQENTAIQEVLDHIVRHMPFRPTPGSPRVRLMDYSGCINFAKQGVKIIREFGVGAAADSPMARLVDKCASKGYARAHLLQVAEACFGWIPPEDRPVEGSASPISLTNEER
jgi:hypothetical protein